MIVIGIILIIIVVLIGIAFIGGRDTSPEHKTTIGEILGYGLFLFILAMIIFALVMNFIIS